MEKIVFFLCLHLFPLLLPVTDRMEMWRTGQSPVCSRLLVEAWFVFAIHCSSVSVCQRVSQYGPLVLHIRSDDTLPSRVLQFHNTWIFTIFGEGTFLSLKHSISTWNWEACPACQLKNIFAVCRHVPTFQMERLWWNVHSIMVSKQIPQY